jgi:hypothetical protein
MKSKLTLFLTSAFLLGVVACTKKTSTVSTNPNPNITLTPTFGGSGTTTDLLGLSTAKYTNYTNTDSIIILNSNASISDSSIINNVSTNPASLPSTINFAFLYLTSNNKIDVGKYSSGSSNTARILGAFQVNGKRYFVASPSPCTVYVDTLGRNYISGTYTATLANNSTDFTSVSVAGRFRSTIQ